MVAVKWALGRGCVGGQEWNVFLQLPTFIHTYMHMHIINNYLSLTDNNNYLLKIEQLINLY